MNKEHYIIYLLLFPNKKKYIGQTKGQRFIIRMNEHKRSKRFSNIDWNNTTILKVGFSTTQKLADDIETSLIKYYQTNDERYGYNKATAGKGHSVNDSVKKQISKSKTGIPISQEHKNAISAGRVNIKQKPMSNDGLKNIQHAAKQRYNNKQHPRDKQGRFIKIK